MTDEWRLPPIQSEDLTEEQKDAFVAGIKPEHVKHFFPVETADMPWPQAPSTLLHHPRLAKRWLAFSYSILHEGVISPRHREIMVLRVGWRTRSAYEWVQHAARIGPRFGITPDEVEAISQDRYDGFDETERDLLAATDEMLDSYRVSADTWKRLAAQFDAAQLEEILFVIGSYTALAMVFESMAVQNEPEWASKPVPKFPEGR